MAIELTPLPLPASADPSYFVDFGREVKGINPGDLTPAQFTEIHDALYKVSSPIIFPRQFHVLSSFHPTAPPAWSSLVPQHCSHARTTICAHQGNLFSLYGLLALRHLTTTVQAFDPQSESYGHGNNKTQSTKKSILHPDLKTIPRVPQVQLIGNGIVTDHEGLATAALKHPSHTTFHRTRISEEDEAKGYTRFYRWHIDAALYDYNPPRVTTLYGITVPKGDRQTVRYDDDTGDELPVPLGTTAFVSGKTMFEILPPELKSLAVRASVRYAPHPYVWMAPARALPTGLGIESEGLELPTKELPEWEESKVKTFPVVSRSTVRKRERAENTILKVWKNPVTGDLHFQVHPCGAQELIIEPVPAGANRSSALYPDGAHIKELAQVRALLYKMQRPAIAPQVSGANLHVR